MPTRDAHTVKKWADAGTVMLGKLATHEFAFGGPSFDLPWPPARNPWNREHFTAGSSSRHRRGGRGRPDPGRHGLRYRRLDPRAGRAVRHRRHQADLWPVSRAGILPLAFTLDHAGPMAWTVEDCALLLQAMAGHDPEDPASVDRPVPDFTAEIGKGVKGLRIGVVRHFFETDHRASDATRAGIDAAMDFFRKEGAEVRDITLSPAADYHAVGYLLMINEAFTLHAPWMRERFMDYGELFRDRVALAATVSGPDIVQATRRRRVLCREMAAAMEDLDIIVSASQPGEAPRIADVPKWANMEKPSFTMPFNVTGFPAISICTGFGEGGLPVVDAARRQAVQPSRLLFRAAHAYETATPWRKKRPAMAG